MTRIILILFLVFFSLFKVQPQYFVDTAKLNQAYRDLERYPRNFDREKAFFNAFPSSWMEFILTYQFFPGRLLYLDIEHINAFGNLSIIPDSSYCDKLIFIAVGGKWEADAPSAFQKILHKNMDKKTDVFFSQLSKLHRGFQLRFWQFYWSSMTHPEDNMNYVREDFKRECELLRNKMKTTHLEEVKTMEIAFLFAFGEITFSKIENNFPHNYFVK